MTQSRFIPQTLLLLFVDKLHKVVSTGEEPLILVLYLLFFLPLISQRKLSIEPGSGVHGSCSKAAGTELVNVGIFRVLKRIGYTYKALRVWLL